MEAENRERWMRLCVEAADGQNSNRLLELISEIDRLLHEKEMRLKNVRREASRYVKSACAKPAPVVQIRPEFRRLTLITARLHLPFASSDLPMLPMSSESAGFLPFSAIPPHLQAIPSQVRSRLP